MSSLDYACSHANRVVNTPRIFSPGYALHLYLGTTSDEAISASASLEYKSAACLCVADRKHCFRKQSTSLPSNAALRS